MKLTLRRNRYQNGCLTIEKRSSGPNVWVYRWRESVGNGRKVQRKRIIGTVKEFPTETAARKKVDALRLEINAEAVSLMPMTVRELAGHYREIELGENCSKTMLTLAVYAHHLDRYIVPRWGTERIGDIKAFRIEAWLKTLNRSEATRAKIKAVFGVIYQHAMRYGWANRNPIREVRQSAKRRFEPDVLTPDEVTALLRALPEYARTMAVVAAVTGLRRGELIGLKWEDVDFVNGKIYIKRSLVNGVEGEPKTEASKRPIPLEPTLARAFRTWRERTCFAKPSDWVFASPYDVGKMPYCPGTVLQKVIRPAAVSVGIVGPDGAPKKIGWQTFRRTTATWLLANGETVKTSQELMRHATATMTLGTYAQAITEDKRAAQSRIAAMLGLTAGEQKQALSA